MTASAQQLQLHPNFQDQGEHSSTCTTMSPRPSPRTISPDVYDSMQCLIEHNFELLQEVQALREEVKTIRDRKNKIEVIFKYEMRSMRISAGFCIIVLVYSHIDEHGVDLQNKLLWRYINGYQPSWCSDEIFTLSRGGGSYRTVVEAMQENPVMFEHQHLLDGVIYHLTKMVRLAKPEPGDGLEEHEWDVLWECTDWK